MRKYVLISLAVLISTLATSQVNVDTTKKNETVRAIQPSDIVVTDTTFIPMRLNRIQLNYLQNLLGEKKINEAVGLWLYLDGLFDKSKKLYQEAEATRRNAMRGKPPK